MKIIEYIFIMLCAQTISSLTRKSFKQLCNIRTIKTYLEKSKDEYPDPQPLIDKYFPLGEKISDKTQLCIESRQQQRRTHGVMCIDRERCRHGFPRAFVRFPVTGGVQSGMIRLSCPHLVKSIDSFEIEGGGIAKFNNILSQSSGDEAPALRENFLDINKTWRSLRAEATSDSDRAFIEKQLGPEGATHFMESGIIGITTDKVDDVKCLHAHVADEILRGKNSIGKSTLTQLESLGINIKGCNGTA